MSDFDTLVGQVEQQQPFRLPVRVVLDADAFLELKQLEQQLERALLRPVDDDVTAVGPEQLAGRIATLLEEHPPTEFVLQACTAARWDELVDKHPSPDGRSLPASFWPAVLAECCVTPEGATVEGFVKLVGDGTVEGKLNSGQRSILVDAVSAVNQGLTDLRPSFAATTLIRGTRRSSTTADREGSPDPGSSDE